MQEVGSNQYKACKPERCGSCPFKTGVSGTRGPEDSPFVIVAESPGTREILSGMPFSGPNGKVLSDMLMELGFGDLDVKPYIIHAFDCLAPKKDMAILQTATRACNGRLQEQLRAHPRKVILCLGVAASWAVTKDYGLRIQKDRGTVIHNTELASHGIVVTYHPAFVQRTGSALGVWKKDLKQAIDLMKGVQLQKWEEPTWETIEDKNTYLRAIDKYLSVPQLITADTETDTLHWMDGRMLCLGLTHKDGKHVDIIAEHLLYDEYDATKHLLESGRWNWHNGLFDIKWFRYLGIQANVHEDTMLMSYAMNENRGFHDLDQVAQQWIGAPKHKAMLDQYLPNKSASYRTIPTDVLHKYAALDISKTHQMWTPMRAKIREDYNDLDNYRSNLIAGVPFLAEMQLYGVEANEEKIRENIVLHDHQLLGIRAKINEYAQIHLGHDINPNSPTQVKELIYTRMKLGLPTASTNENALIEAKRKHEHPIIDLLLDHREVAKRKGTYVSNILADPDRKKNPRGFIKSDGRVHADYKLHGTATGRLAGADPNMLNQPRGPFIRSQFRAARGKIFVEVDLNQAELRSLALMSGDPVLMDIYTKNEVSIHDVTTGKFFAPKDAILADPAVAAKVRLQLHAGAHITDDKLYGEAKMRGKAVNFGIVYGREAFSLAREFDISIREAQRWIDDWMNLYAGAADFIDWCRRAPAENRTIVTMFGRKKRPGLISRDTLKNTQNEFANFPHQSTASDIMFHTAIEVQPVLVQRWDAHIWNELYDAIYFELDADDEKVAESIAYVQDVITKVPRRRGLLRVPFMGDAKIGYSWGTMKDWKGSIKDTLGDENPWAEHDHPRKGRQAVDSAIVVSK